MTKTWEEVPRTNGGNVKQNWLLAKLGIDKDETIIAYNIPGTDAVVLRKADYVNGLPDRIKQVLKTEEELQAEIQDAIQKAIEEHDAAKGQPALLEGTDTPAGE